MLKTLGRSVYLTQFEEQRASLSAFAAGGAPVFISLHISEEFDAAYCARVQEMCDFLSAQGWRILADVSEKTIRQFGCADLTALADSLQGISFLDVSAALSAHTDGQLYYRTDHHWTSLGARYAFEAMAEKLGIPQPIQNYDTYTVSTTFEGTLASRSGSHAAYDTVELYVPQTDVEYYVSYGDAAETSATIYDRSALDQKDKYTVFFGGNYPRVDVYTTAETGKTLLLFKDSYANCLMQFLYPYYDHIILIDPRYYYDNVESVISREQVTDVLFLYNANTYFEDTSLADVLNVSEN